MGKRRGPVISKNDMVTESTLYKKVEVLTRPIVESNAKKFCASLGMTVDEARQECRYALILALRKYDHDASRGGIYNFVSKAVRNHLLKLIATSQRQVRSPHIYVSGDGKRRKAVKSSFVPNAYGPWIHHKGEIHEDSVDITDHLPSPDPLPDEPLMLAVQSKTMKKFREKLEGVLNDRERRVLHCKIDPPVGLRTIMIEECVAEPTIPMIMRHLGLSKHAVDWSLNCIRKKACSIMSRNSDFGDLVSSGAVRNYLARHR